MFKRILFLPTVLFLILAASLWTAPTASSFPNVPPNGQVPLAGSAIPQFVDQLPFLHTIPDWSLSAQFQGAISTFPSTPTAGDVVYLKTVVGANLPGYYSYDGATWGPVLPIELRMTEFQTNILPTGFVPPGIVPPATFTGTYVWGYQEPAQAGTAVPSYIGPVIVAKRYHPGAAEGANGAPTAIKYVNNLGTAASTQVLAWKYSTDQTMHWADPLANEANDCAKQVSLGTFPNAESALYPAPNTLCASNYGENPATHSFNDAPIPAVVHLHGGEVPPMLDGGPDAWFLSGAFGTASISGHGYYTFGGNQGDPATDNTAVYRYPNTQEAANIWFHDHVLGITRLNVYAGMAGAYVLLDPVTGNPNNPAPANLPKGRPIPGTADTEHLIPLVIQDRMFDTNGQLFFPADTTNNLLWTTNPEHPYWVPEFVGDTIVVNGKTWPTVGTLAAPLEAKRYRFLFLNGSNARTYELFLTNQTAGGTPGPPMWVIGTDGGYLDTPAKIDPALGQKLVIMPGERYDVIIDFSGFANSTLLMRNTGRTPYPKGASPQGATLGRIVQFFIGVAPGADNSYNPALLPGTPGYQPLRSVATVRLPGAGGPAINPSNVQLTRQLTLNEVMGLPKTVTDPVTGTPMTAYPGGPLEVVLNNTKWSGERLLSAPNTPGVPGTLGVYLEHIPDSIPFPGGATPIGQIFYTELPKEGDTEVWEIINITADAHPIHLHLVQFQIIDRQNFNVNNYMKAYAAAFPGGVLAEAFGPPYNYSNSTNPDFCPAGGCTTPPTTVGGNPDIRKLGKNLKPIYLQGMPSPPLPAEAGWKDTVVSYPGQVLRLAVRWAPTDMALNTPAAQLHFPFNPDGGHGYVWHCHIIDHEDNEMMRPTQVQLSLTAPAPIDRPLKQGAHY